MHEIHSCQSPPPREEFDALLWEYYALMIERIEASGHSAPGGPQAALSEYWNEVEKYLPPYGRTFLARNETGDLVGCGTLKALEDQKGELKRLYVKPSERGTGLGRRLVDIRIQEARDMGLKTLLVDTLKPNVEMRSLYKSMGFEEIDAYSESATVQIVPDLMPILVFFKMDIA